VLSQSDNSESEQEAEEKLDENDIEPEEDEQDDRAFKRQRIEVELTMPELPLPASKDDKVSLTLIEHLSDINITT
jgi:hypothetical protein